MKFEKKRKIKIFFLLKMGIGRDSRHKRRATGGRMPIHKKKRAFEKGRQVSMTKLVSGEKRVRRIRVRGGNFKFRALRLFEGRREGGDTLLLFRKLRLGK